MPNGISIKSDIAISSLGDTALVNLLIPYRPMIKHRDPLLGEFTYGDSNARAQKLKKDLQKGDYVFFHTTIRGLRYITAYYVIDRVLDTAVAASNQDIASKYKNPHIIEYLKGKRREEADVVIFGDPILSQELKRPLPFTQELAMKLSLGIEFKKEFTENQCIGSSTRSWRVLEKSDVKVLKEEILNIKETISKDTIISTDEVMEILEADLEGFIVSNPQILGTKLKLEKKQEPTQDGRIDLVYKDETDNFVIVELKLGSIGTAALNQLRRYIHWYKNQTHKEVRGIIVCKDIMPAFEENYGKLTDIKVLCYGWKLAVYPYTFTLRRSEG